MKRSEVALILAKVAIGDNRRLDPPPPPGVPIDRHPTPILDFWCEQIGDLSFTDCQTAVRDHFRESGDWLKPVHIRDRAERTRAERLRDLPVEEITNDVPSEDTDAYQLTLKARTAAIADGCPVDQVKAAVPVVYPHAIGDAR